MAAQHVAGPVFDRSGRKSCPTPGKPKRTLPLARMLIQPMQAFYCCIVCITVIDAE